MVNINEQTINLYAWWEGAFTDEEIDRIVAIGNNQILQDSKLDNGEVLTDNNRRSTNAWLYPTDDTKWVYEKLCGLMNHVNQQYFNYDITLQEPFQFASYDSTRQEFYGKHLDTTFSRPSSAASRKLSMVLQLTDPDAYEGGELALYQCAEPTLVPKKKGMLVMFPSFIMHEVTPVTKGTRYSLVSWCHGPLFK